VRFATLTECGNLRAYLVTLVNFIAIRSEDISYEVSMELHMSCVKPPISIRKATK
jgi:hypothetical protein